MSKLGVARKTINQGGNFLRGVSENVRSPNFYIKFSLKMFG